MNFIVATNSYRAFGGKFAGTRKENVIYVSPDSSRDVLANYITEQTAKWGQVSAAPTYNWHLKTINTHIPLDIRFETQNSPKADRFIIQHQQIKMTKIATNNIGFAEYRLELATVKPTK
ncbi:hypothetical protein [uncultured Shewanella sp.]|uniref:hypothetical protein n=1 Tax=uncultured Shewanella sp. TaxID=173975 RepID=UPI0026176594|nr:hypothetical protein [uncultured Shewanella sp.]